MKNTFLTLATLAALSSFQFAHAQREAPDRAAKREQRQQQMQQMTPTERTQFRQQRFEERLKSATPEQRERMTNGRAQREARMKEQGLDLNNPADRQNARQARSSNRQGRRGQNALDPAARDAARRALMSSAGFPEKDLQDAIIAFMDAEESARQPLLRLARAAATSLAKGGASANPTGAATQTLQVRATNLVSAEAEVSRTFEAYQNAMVSDKKRHQTALAGLDAKVSYSTNPRLKAFLTLVGILDSDALALGGAAAIFASATPQNDATQNAARAARRANRGNRNGANATANTGIATQ